MTAVAAHEDIHGGPHDAHLLFGIEDNDLHHARTRLEAALGIEMTMRQSMYLRGDYYLSGSEREHVMLQPNFNRFEDEWTEPHHRQCGLLLYVNETDRPEVIRAALEGIATLIWTKKAL